VKRTYMLLAVVASLSGAGGIGRLAAQSTGGAVPGGAAPERKDPPRIAVFNAAKVMSEFQKWKYWSVTMVNKRIASSGELAKIQVEMKDIEKRAQAETRQVEREQLVQMLLAKQRQWEDLDRQTKNRIDEEAAAHLKVLYSDIQRAVAAFVQSNGYDIVFAYPDAITPEDKQRPEYIQSMVLPGGAMPFHVSKSVDLTDNLIVLLNKSFPAPGPIPSRLAGPDGKVEQTGGTSPQPTPPGPGAAPVARPPGTPAGR
jgi:Skp family chaperone for outer membrane proteins